MSVLSRPEFHNEAEDLSNVLKSVFGEGSLAASFFRE